MAKIKRESALAATPRFEGRNRTDEDFASPLLRLALHHRLLKNSACCGPSLRFTARISMYRMPHAPFGSGC